MACSAAASAIAGAAGSLSLACSQHRAAASRSTPTSGSQVRRYPCRPPTMMPEPSTPRSLLTSVATFCSAAAGRSPAHSTSTIRSTGTRVGRSTASSFSNVRDLRLPTSRSGSSVPPRMTPKVPARRNSICREPAIATETSFPTSTSYRRSAASARAAVRRPARVSTTRWTAADDPATCAPGERYRIAEPPFTRSTATCSVR